jgi:DNA processing protein
MTTQEALVSLNLVLDIGSIRLNKLLYAFGAPQNILAASRESLMAVEGVGEKIAAEISALKEEDAAREFTRAEKLGIKIITCIDREYPVNLKEIIDPPVVLYIKGQIKAQDALGVAIVGSRKASFYGLSQAERLAGELSWRGVTVISGLARGIDTCAHRGALKYSGRTIAVIGSGFDRMYPEENNELMEAIAQQGAVVSEFPLATPPYGQNFVRRNRVISGLSLGVLVVEASRNSGALITADFALQQGRDVFALPGEIGVPTAYGTNRLIQDGAKSVLDVDDILAELGFESHPRPRRRASGGLTDSACALTQHEERLFAAIKQEPQGIDEILEKTHLAYSQAAPLLVGLQMKKAITQLPGHQFKRN